MELKYKIISLIKIFQEKGLNFFSKETHFSYSFTRILKKYSFEHNIIEWIVNFNNLKVKIRKENSDAKVFVQIFEHHEYRILLELLDSFKDDKEYVVLDCGANVGYTSLYLSQTKNKIKFICIEPFRETKNYLEGNLKINNLDHEIICKVLWTNSKDKLALKDFRDGLAWSKSFELSDSTNQITYDSIDLNSIINNYSLNVIDILKIDIEGAEAKLFKDENFLTTLKNNVKLLAIEVHEEFIKNIEVENKLKTLGFIYFHSGELIIAINKNLDDR